MRLETVRSVFENSMRGQFRFVDNCFYQTLDSFYKRDLSYRELKHSVYLSKLTHRCFSFTFDDTCHNISVKRRIVLFLLKQLSMKRPSPVIMYLTRLHFRLNFNFNLSRCDIYQKGTRAYFLIIIVR